MRVTIQQHIRLTIEELQRSGEWPIFDIPSIDITYPKNDQFGDYTTNIALVLAKLVGRNPLDVAEAIRTRLTIPNIEAIEVAKPGYLNFHFSQEYLKKLVADIYEHGIVLEKQPGKVMIEYSQPNTHKEFHIGHLRNVFIGCALVNTLRKAGYETIAANYFGDTGTHVAKCLWGLQKFHANDPIDEVENKAELLGKVYSEASQKIEGNPEYEGECKALQKRFEAGDPELVALWEKTKQWSLEEFYRIYRQLGITFDVVFYESVEEEEGKALLPELLERNIAEKSDGAVIANLEAYKLEVLVLVRRDGSALYGLKDIPLAKKKFEEYGIDRSIHVVDVRQSLYFQQLFKILELYGFHKDMVHIGYEFVALRGGESMSSRKGNIISARFLIEQVTEKVRQQFPESPNPESIAIGAIRFAMLKHSSGSKIEFDIDESVKLDGATGPYVQYAVARMASILRKAEEAGIVSVSKEATLVDQQLHPREIDLIRELEKFPKLIEEVAKSYEIHKLSHYALRVADKFHSFYNDCKVLDPTAPDLSRWRLRLVRATNIVLSDALHLIGVDVLEKM